MGEPANWGDLEKKVSATEACNFMVQVFSCEFYEIFKKILFL